MGLWEGKGFASGEEGLEALLGTFLCSTYAEGAGKLPFVRQVKEFPRLEIGFVDRDSDSDDG